MSQEQNFDPERLNRIQWDDELGVIRNKTEVIEGLTNTPQSQGWDVEKGIQEFDTKCLCKPSGLMQISNPPRYRCEVCGCTWGFYEPIPYCLKSVKPFLVEFAANILEAERKRIEEGVDKSKKEYESDDFEDGGDDEYRSRRIAVQDARINSWNSAISAVKTIIRPK